MVIDSTIIARVVDEAAKKASFSGVVFVQQKEGDLFTKGYGFANRAESIPNTDTTRFAIASGAKVFTGIAVCQLVEAGLISFDTPLRDCLDTSFPEFDRNISIRHLLTHSSGIPDYFDEELMEDHEFAELWKDRPMYTIRTPRDFLPMIQGKKMKFRPGERFSYSNAGFIVLGLVVEQQAGPSFTEYVEKNIFGRCAMTGSGYFAMDQLPKRTAYGYLDDEADGPWKTNIYSVPIIGGPDGGAFTTAPDISTFWTALFNNQLLGKAATEEFLTPHIEARSEGDGTYYGYGVWISKREGSGLAYYITGSDPGVEFVSKIFPELDILITVIGNSNRPISPVYNELETLLVV